MSSYTNNTPTFDNGNSTSWPALGPNLFYVDNLTVAFGRFTGATSVLAGSVIDSATLTIDFGTFAPVMTDESLEIWAELAEDALLPADWTDASARVLSVQTALSGTLNGLSTIDIDLTDVIQELQSSVDGDVIMLKFANLSYSGTGLQSGPGMLTFSLAISYDSTPPVTLGNPLTIMKCCC